ncbi:MAG TPA: PASTA domain-containing protein, partial [Acidimicrobiia bacterium]
ILLFVLFRLAGGGNISNDLVEVPNVAGLTRQGAEARLITAGFTVKFTAEASQDVEVDLVIRTNPAGGTEAEPDSEVEVFYSTGAEEFEVPPLIGQTQEAAERIIEQNGFVLGEVVEEPSAEFAEGTVIRQDPNSGVLAGRGAAISITVSTGAETHILPVLEGETERDAVTALQRLGLLSTVNDEFSNTVDEGLVIRTEPEAGAEVRSGDTILLVVSQGPRPVEVPNLLGSTQGQAEGILADLGLEMNVSASTQPVVDASQDGRVVAQFPDDGVEVFPGDVVTVTLGKFTPPPTTTTTTATPPST